MPHLLKVLSLKQPIGSLWQTQRICCNAVRFCSGSKTTASETPGENQTEKQIEETDDRKLGGFAKAFEKHAAPVADKSKDEPSKTFASLMRNSKFVDVRQ